MAPSSVSYGFQGHLEKEEGIVFAIAYSHCPHRAALPHRLSLLGCWCQSKGKSTQYATQVLYTDTMTGNSVFHIMNEHLF